MAESSQLEYIPLSTEGRQSDEASVDKAVREARKRIREYDDEDEADIRRDYEMRRRAYVERYRDE